MPGDAVGQDGLPICDEFACRTWGCWCPRINAVLAMERCIHGNHPAECHECEEATDDG